MTEERFLFLYSYNLSHDYTAVHYMDQEESLACATFLRKAVIRGSMVSTSLDGYRLATRNTRPECFTPWEE